jgi:signal transduction histidine kinase
MCGVRRFQFVANIAPSCNLWYIFPSVRLCCRRKRGCAINGGGASDAEKRECLLKSELAETQKTTTQYLQNVAHQLTAPLKAIKWSIEAIKDEKVPIPRKLSLLSSIYSQGTILVHLIRLTMS